jgi:hypothetical protein
MRLIAYIIGGPAVLCGSFFSTLWLTEPEAAPQRLEDQRISHYNDLPTAAQNAGLRYSEQMKGNVDGFSRINERDVKVEMGCRHAGRFHTVKAVCVPQWVYDCIRANQRGASFFIGLQLSTR